MGGLLSGGAPLRGRASLELIVPAFDFRQAAEFWGISDRRLTAMLYFVAGGTPAYRTEFLRGAAPASLARFDEWADISHHLTVLEDAGLLVREPDAFRENRSQYRITEPLVRFYHSVMRPSWAQLERVRPGRTERIWAASRDTFLSKAAGPAFGHMCRIRPRPAHRPRPALYRVLTNNASGRSSG